MEEGLRTEEEVDGEEDEVRRGATITKVSHEFGDKTETSLPKPQFILLSRCDGVSGGGRYGPCDFGELRLHGLYLLLFLGGIMEFLPPSPPPLASLFWRCLEWAS
jgi:hypothetical protein